MAKPGTSDKDKNTGGGGTGGDKPGTSSGQKNDKSYGSNDIGVITVQAGTGPSYSTGAGKFAGEGIIGAALRSGMGGISPSAGGPKTPGKPGTPPAGPPNTGTSGSGVSTGLRGSGKFTSSQTLRGYRSQSWARGGATAKGGDTRIKVP